MTKGVRKQQILRPSNFSGKEFGNVLSKCVYPIT